MEYSACVKYHEKAGEWEEKVETLVDVTDTSASITASKVPMNVNRVSGWTRKIQ